MTNVFSERKCLFLKPWQVYVRRMTLESEQVIVHSVDLVTLGQWWAEALGWVVVHSSADEFEIRPEPNRLPGLDFVRRDERKKAKNRLHLDFRPDDQDAEVTRLVAHGAQRVDIGQGDQSWVVLADPEGTFESFCSAVVSPTLSSDLAISRNLWDDGADLAVHARAFMQAELERARR